MPDEHPCRLLGVRAGSDAQADVRLGESEILVEQGRELAVVVLPRVERDEVDASVQRRVQRSGLDELGPVARDREEAHYLRP